MVERYVSGIVLTGMSSLGLLGNTITLFILNMNKEMRKQPINVYLTVLALYDNGVLFNAILMLGIPNICKLLSNSASTPSSQEHPLTVLFADNQTSTYGVNQHDTVYAQDRPLFYTELESHFNASYLDDDDQLGNFSTVSSQLEQEQHVQDPLYMYIRIVYPLALISQTGSIWTTCLITAERYLAVCHPLRSLTLSTRSRAVWALLALSVGAFVYNIPRFAEVEIMESNGTTYVQRSDLRQNVIYYWLYYILLHLALLYVIPLSLLSVLNTKIYITIRRATRNRTQLTRQEQSEYNIASMLVLLVAIFIGCNAPAFIVNCLELTNTHYFQTAITFSNLLVCFNSSVNFIIYCE